MRYSTLHEISPRGGRDCFSLFSPSGRHPDSRPHLHDEYELGLVLRPGPLIFTLGDHAFSITGPVLVLTAPGAPHGWSGGGDPAGDVEGVWEGQILRFGADLLSGTFLGKSQMRGIDDLLERARQGICFPGDTIGGIMRRMSDLGKKKGFEAFLELLAILHELSAAPDQQVLCPGMDMTMAGSGCEESDRLIESAVAYMRENYDRPISLGDVAGRARMSRGSFCRSIMKKTGKTYLESLNEIRMGHVCGMLVGSTENISEIAYKTGYKNVTYFNRWFKRQKGCTPKEYRESLAAG